MTSRIKPQTVVEHGGRRGVTVSDLPGMLSCCADWETPVVWEGESFFSGTNTDELAVVGSEDAQADFEGCGAGQGPECCVFLTVGRDGPSCERHGSMRYDIIFRVDKMTAKRQPVELYPSCKRSLG